MKFLQSKQKKIINACHDGDVETVGNMIKDGFDINHVFNDGWYYFSLMTIALGNVDKKMVNFLIESNCDIKKVCLRVLPIHKLVTSFSDQEEKSYESLSDLITTFVEKGFDINERLSSNGATPLLLAAKYGDIELVELLLELGADKNIPDNDNKKPYEVANLTTIRKLLIIDTIDDKIKDEGWQKLGKNKIALIENDLPISRSKTEIFNFISSDKGTVTTILTNLQTDSESSFKESMSSFVDTDKIQEASRKLKLNYSASNQKKAVLVKSSRIIS